MQHDTNPHAMTPSDVARRIRRARLAAALARLESVRDSADWNRVPAFDRLAILREIRATRSALTNGGHKAP